MEGKKESKERKIKIEKGGRKEWKKMEISIQGRNQEIIKRSDDLRRKKGR